MAVEEARELVFANIKRLPEIFKDKSARYGDAWYDDGSIDAVQFMFAEVNAKYQRLRTMVWDNDAADKATSAETYLDLALYSIMSASVLMDQMTEEELKRLEDKLRV